VDSQVQIRDRIVRELAETGPPPLGSLVADALARGVRLRRRRWYTVLASGLAALAVMVSAGVLLAGRPVGGLSAPGAAASPTAEVPKVERSEPAASPTPAALVIPPGHRATTGEAVIALLIDLLPPGGEISEVDFWGDSGVASGGFVYDDGRGAATVSAGVADRPTDYGSTVTGMGCPTDAPDMPCEYSVRPDGIELRVLRLGPYDCTDAKCSIQDLRVEIRRPDGVYVMVDSFNGPFGGGRPATRDETLLDLDQMLAIARDPRWGLTMEASFVDAAPRRIPR
jgi:hypothetical protein